MQTAPSQPEHPSLDGREDRLMRHLREVVRERDPFGSQDGHSLVKDYDRIATLDLEFLTAVCSGLIAGLASL